MNFFQRLFGTQGLYKIADNKSFWEWFIQNERNFFLTVQSRRNIDSHFLKRLMPKLQELNSQFYCLAGMYDDDTAELIVTAEGDIKTFVFAEELIAAAPPIKKWKFTALKQATSFKSMVIEMDGYRFDDGKIYFFSNDDAAHPDEIDISLVHTDFNEKDKKTITNGSFIYLDNLLGELNAATLVDNITVIGPGDDLPPLIPINKLSDFLIWREKEFVEKHRGLRHYAEHDSFTVFEAKDEGGLPSVAIINQDLLSWDAKASHPWMLIIEIKYDGASNNGMPDDKIHLLMNEFEDELSVLLPDRSGYLNLGRETYKNVRTIYFGCKEFRRVSKIAAAMAGKYSGRLHVSYDILKDKYWMVMDRFKQTEI